MKSDQPVRRPPWSKRKVEDMSLFVALAALVGSGRFKSGYKGRGHPRGHSKRGRMSKATARRRMRYKMAHKSRVYNSMRARGKR